MPFFPTVVVTFTGWRYLIGAAKRKYNKKFSQLQSEYQGKGKGPPEVDN